MDTIEEGHRDSYLRVTGGRENLKTIFLKPQFSLLSYGLFHINQFRYSNAVENRIIPRLRAIRL